MQTETMNRPLVRHDRHRRWLRRIATATTVVLSVIGAFRLWVRGGAREGAPRIGMVIGDDWMNRIGVHQATYEAVITHAGGKVVSLDPRDPRAPDAILDEVDALVLTGGGDVDPALAGTDPERAQLVDRRRDDFEIALVRRALARDIPVLGVCRGHQLLNVMFGGTLRDLRDDATAVRTHGITVRSLDAHLIAAQPGSRLDAIVGSEPLPVNSFHGQAIGDVAPTLQIAATSPDGVVEALEVPGERFALSVQWHPEILYWVDRPSRRIFERLMTEARLVQRRRAET